MATVMGMEFLSTPESDTCMARMKVDENSRQPMGYLSGGASLALAETLAGAGSSALCPDKICVGINVSGTHVKAVPLSQLWRVSSIVAIRFMCGMLTLPTRQANLSLRQVSLIT